MEKITFWENLNSGKSLFIYIEGNVSFGKQSLIISEAIFSPLIDSDFNKQKIHQKSLNLVVCILTYIALKWTYTDLIIIKLWNSDGLCS